MIDNRFLQMHPITKVKHLKGLWVFQIQFINNIKILNLKTNIILGKYIPFIKENIKEKWNNKIIKPLDKQKAIKSVECLYEFCGLDKPKY